MKRTTDSLFPILQEDDELNLAPEDEEPFCLATENDDSTAAVELTPTAETSTPLITPTTWKAIIADDDREIHEVTRLALQGFTFMGKPLTLLSVYSGREAKELLTQHPDLALILLDVVMAENHSGLEVVKYIRQTLQNKLLRIILPAIPALRRLF